MKSLLLAKAIRGKSVSRSSWTKASGTLPIFHNFTLPLKHAFHHRTRHGLYLLWFKVCIGFTCAKDSVQGMAMVIWSVSYPVFVRTNLLHLEPFRTFALCHLARYLKNINGVNVLEFFFFF